MLTQPPTLPLPLLLHLRRHALPKDLPRLHRDLALPMLEDEVDARGGSRVLLASDMVRPFPPRSPLTTEPR